MIKRRFYLIFISCILTFALLSSSVFSSEKQEKQTPLKKVVMIIAHKNFRDEELNIPKAMMEKAGIKVDVASSSKDTAVGMLGTTVKPDILIEEIDAKDYDAFIFVGGVGASFYWNNKLAHSIAQKALKQGKILCAICIAPITLANAGVLKGKKATVWPGEKEKLIAKGAIYTGNKVEVDGNIITASGPDVAEKFGEKIIQILLSTESTKKS